MLLNALKVAFVKQEKKLEAKAEKKWATKTAELTTRPATESRIE
jgi:hypothetical protein